MGKEMRRCVRFLLDFLIFLWLVFGVTLTPLTGCCCCCFPLGGDYHEIDNLGGRRGNAKKKQGGS